MRPWMLAMFGRKRVSTFETFFENVTWTAPLTTNMVTVSGNGAPGPAGTTGAGASAFGKVFPGGTNGTATLVTYPNVAVEPGKPYQFTVPSGGFIGITYEY